ncbi:MAG: hypothetical protein JKX99_08135 [Robiginitomaculum sp.]|nr:hypothetical protein [Robiginitomaculum sp.]
MTSFALIITGAILGAMAFFGFFVAPAAANAGSSSSVLALSRAVFPKAFDLFAVLSVLAAMASTFDGNQYAAACLVIATCSFLYAGWTVTPALEAARDAAKAGNHEALAVFARSRSSAISANALQYLALLAAMIFLSF